MRKRQDGKEREREREREETENTGKYEQCVPKCSHTITSTKVRNNSYLQ